jgi:hypothetical protein
MIRLRGLKFLGVTAVAIGGHSGVVTQSTVLMTGVALDGGMRAQQRKAIVVVLNLLRLNLPASDGVALLTVSSEFAAVNVGMTFGA